MLPHWIRDKEGRLDKEGSSVGICGLVAVVVSAG
jgi:hypothetical protein